MKDIRVMKFTDGQQIESDEVMQRLGQLEYRNHGGMARIGLFDEGKALITSGLRVSADSGLTVTVATGTLFQREIDVTGCIQKDEISVTLDAASGVARTDIIECQIKMMADKDDTARIGTVATGTTAGSVIITNEEIKRDLRFYVSARKQTGTTTPTAATAGTLTGTVAITGTLDLSEKYIIHISDGPDGDWTEIDCRGAVPNATTKSEIISAINSALGRTAASAGAGDVIVLTGEGVGEGSYFAIKPPVTDADADALEEIFGVSIGGLYRYEYQGDNSWIKLAEIDMGSATTTITNSLIRNIEQKDTWTGETDEVIVRPKIYTINEPDWNEWSALRTYAAGDIAYIADVQFLSLAGGNINKDPLFETDWWMPAPSLSALLVEANKGQVQRGGVHDIHNYRSASYKQWFNIAKYNIGNRTVGAYGVHLDGTTETGDADLESIFNDGESNEYPFLDLFAPDSLGTRTLLDYRGRVPRATDDTGGDTEDVSEVQEDQMQRITGQIGSEDHIRAYYGPTDQAGALYPVDSDILPSTQSKGSIPNSSSIVGFDSADSPDARTSADTDGETRMKNWTEGVPYLIVLKEI